MYHGPGRGRGNRRNGAVVARVGLVDRANGTTPSPSSADTNGGGFDPALPRALTRFRLPWRWDGGPATLCSRATDDSGYVQPSREALLAERGARTIFHYNGFTCWGVATSGELTHVYA